MKNKFLNYSYGGRVVGNRSLPVLAVLKGGEYVLPFGVKPTKKQLEAVAKMNNKKHNALKNILIYK